MEKGNTNRRFYILSAEPLNNTQNDFRLGLMQIDFNSLRERAANINEVRVVLDDHEIIINHENALNTYQNFGNLVNPEISKWIVANNLDITPKGKPAKIIFELKILKLTHTYSLYKFQMNLICN